MKFNLILMSAILFVGCSKVVPNMGTIPAEHRAILAGDWNPSNDEAVAALDAISQFVSSYRERRGEFWEQEIEKLKSQFPRYYVQIVGRLSQGTKLIHCNFFMVNQSGPSPKWKEEKVLTLDGGINYWRIDFDVQSKKCINFKTNGYA